LLSQAQCSLCRVTMAWAQRTVVVRGSNKAVSADGEVRILSAECASNTNAAKKGAMRRNSYTEQWRRKQDSGSSDQPQCSGDVQVQPSQRAHRRRTNRRQSLAERSSDGSSSHHNAPKPMRRFSEPIIRRYRFSDISTEEFERRFIIKQLSSPKNHSHKQPDTSPMKSPQSLVSELASPMKSPKILVSKLASPMKSPKNLAGTTTSISSMSTSTSSTATTSCGGTSPLSSTHRSAVEWVKCYYDRQTGQTHWKLPTEGPAAEGCSKWVECYYNTDTGETQWDIPAEQKHGVKNHDDYVNATDSPPLHRTTTTTTTSSSSSSISPGKENQGKGTRQQPNLYGCSLHSLHSLYKIEQACKRASNADSLSPAGFSKVARSNHSPTINMSSLGYMAGKGPPSPVNHEEMQMMRGDRSRRFGDVSNF